MNKATHEAIVRHGNNLLAIFPRATEHDPVKLCKKLRRLEDKAESWALRGCNGPEWSSEDARNEVHDAILSKVNALLGNVNEYQPKTGAKCVCRHGTQRDNCPTCEGTGYVINFAAIRNQRSLVPVFINGDPRGYALKIDDAWMQANNVTLHRDWGGYGIIAPYLNQSHATP